jgi:hypothetical protein
LRAYRRSDAYRNLKTGGDPAGTKENQVRLIKMLGLAVVAAVAAMAFVGAGSAMATTSTALCKVVTNPCPAASIYPKGTVIEALAEDPKLLGKFLGIEGTILCEHSLVSGTTTTTGGLATAPTPLTGSLTALSFTGNCKDSTGGTCTVTVPTLGTIDLLRTAANLGFLKSLGTQVLVVCSGGLISVNCTFGGEPELHAVGTTEKAAELTATKAKLVAVKGSSCPTNPLWDALYKVLKPTPLFINE